MRRSTSAPLPKGAGGAKDARVCVHIRSGKRQGPAAAACCERLRPVEAAGFAAAGSGERQRESHFDPWNSLEIVLSKHEGCDEESVRRQVQGALDRVWWPRAAVSQCAMQGGLAGRTW